MQRIHFTLAEAVYAALFSVALCLVELDLLTAERTAVGVAAALWLGVQAIGLGIHRLGLGIDERWFWGLFADQPDGSMNSVARRRVGRIVHGVLTHFSLMRFPQGLRARAVVSKPK